MAKQRIVNTKFWDDSYIAGLSVLEKLLFLYLITNPLTNISGVYELSIKRAALDVGLPVRKLEKVFNKLEADGKITRFKEWIGIKNFVKHQSLNPKVKTGIEREMRNLPKELLDRLCFDPSTLFIAYQSLPHSDSDHNKDPDLNSDGIAPKKLSTAEAEEIKRRKEALREKYKVTA